MNTEATPSMDGAMRAHYQRHGRLQTLHLDLLYACDLDCHHCYLDDKRRPQVDTAELVRVLEEAAAAGAITVLFSGGEIFLRKDLFTILEAARRLRYHIRLKTHGGNITEDDARRIKDLGVALVDFSVYALDAEVHDAFTQVSGSLARTLLGIDRLHAAGVEVEVKCTVTTYNLEHYRALSEHFRSRGIPCMFNAKVRGTNTINTSTYPLNVEAEDKVKVEVYRLEQAGGPPPPKRAPAPEVSHFCSAGRSMLYVAPDLKVYPCVSYPLPVGDLTMQSLREVWTGSPELPAVRAMTRADTGICGSCAARNHCSYCPGAAYIESAGDALLPPAVVCATSFAKLEAEERYLRGERTTPHDVVSPKRKARFAIRSGGAERPTLPNVHGAEHAGGCSCG